MRHPWARRPMLQLPPWVNLEMKLCVLVLAALLTLRLVGGTASRGTKPFTVKALLWLAAVWIAFALPHRLPSATADAVQFRFLALLIAGAAVAALAGPKLAANAALAKLHPALPLFAGWALIGLTLESDAPVVTLLLTGFLPFEKVQTALFCFHLVLAAVAVAMLAHEVRRSTPTQVAAKRSQERHNNIHALRIVLASGVVVHHACHFAARYHPGPDRFDIGWVAAFLCLAGLLIPNSRATSRESTLQLFHREIRVPGAGVFVAKRLLRVYPAMLFGFALCLAFFGWEGLKTFVSHTYLIGGIGGYGTITVEEICYAGLMILWALGAYMKDGRKRAAAIWIGFGVSFAFAAAAQWLHLHREVLNGALHISGEIGDTYQYYATLPQFFFLGNLFWVYSDKARKVPTWVYAALFAATLLLPASPFRPLNQAIDVLRIAGLFGVFVYSRPVLSWVQRYGDPSYSIFLFHYFVMERLSSEYHLSFWPLFGLSYGITAMLAYASWFALEEPVLMLKNRFRSPRAA